MPHEAKRALEGFPDGVVLVDPSGQITFVNAAAEHLLRTSSSRCVGRELAEGLSHAPDLLQLATDAISSPGLRVFRSRVRSALPSAQQVSAVGTFSPDLGLILSLRDASLSADLAEDARRSDHIASMQAVADGVAHEIKNPLGGMRGAIQLLARRLKDDEDAREYIDVILSEIERVTAIVDTLKDLAHPDTSIEPVEIDLNQILREIALLQGAGSSETFALAFDPALPAVFGDPSELTQAFLNIVRNALDAGAQHVRIETRVETGMSLVGPDGSRHPLVRIEIRDDGPGIPEDVQQQIFTPFFTTKAEGSGLGLATTQRIIAAHRGRIHVENVDPQGARFVITLPAGPMGHDS